MRKLIIAILLFSLIPSSFGYYVMYQGYLQYQKEGKCIAELISQGVERSDIGVNNGSCYVRK